ncbi:MAG: GspH/FimT family pseudopilin [Ectothiorhodospiraceae bacterium]
MESRTANGFTLLQLLITVTVAAILATVAVPAFQEFLERQRSQAAIAELRNALALGRQEAAQSGSSVTVCPTANGEACRNDGDWSDGWMVFEDPDRLETCDDAGNGQCNHGGRVFSVHPGVSGAVTINGNALIEDAVTFRPQGFAKLSNGTFTVCSADGEILRGLVVAWSGRMRKAGPGDSTACP